MSIFSPVVLYQKIKALLRGHNTLDHAGMRNRRIGLGLISSAAQKAIAFGVSILSVPLAVGYLGEEQYGLWLAITSVLGWIALSDLGISNSLSLAISKAFGEEDIQSANKSISSGFFMLCGVAALLTILYFACVSFIQWDVLFKVESPAVRNEISHTVTIAFLIFVIGFPLSVAGRILTGYQEFVASNLWATAGSLATLGALWIACTLKTGLPGLVACFSGSGLLISIVLCIWLFGTHKPCHRPSLKHYDRMEAHRLLRQGFWFFVTGITWIINSQTDLAIISHFLGAKEVTPYALSTKLFSYTTMLQTILAGSLVPSYAEAFARKDIPWIKKTLKRHLLVSAVITLAICIVFSLFGRPIIRLWAGKDTAAPDQEMLAWMAAWNFLVGIAYPISIALTGLGRVRNMALYGSAASLVNLILSVILVRSHGVTGVVAASAISFAVVNMPFTIIDIINNLKKISVISHTSASAR